MCLFKPTCTVSSLFFKESTPPKVSITKQSGAKAKEFQTPSNSTHPKELGVAGVGELQANSRKPSLEPKNDGKMSKHTGKVKQAIVSKLSETIGENVNCFGVGMSLTFANY